MTTPIDDRRRDDEGSIFVLVLVMTVIGALLVLPLLSYTMSVFRASTVESAKAESVEMARGGTWVALSNEGALFDMCVGGELPSSLPERPRRRHTSPSVICC